MKNFGVRASIAVVVAMTMTIGGVATTASAAPRDDVFSLTNQQRYSAGLPNLQRNASLDAAAQEWAQQMADTGSMVHSPNAWRQARIPTGWRTHGENIAYGQRSASAVVSAWMGSTGHRQNILRPTFTHMGVGYVASGNYWVQIFAGYDRPLTPPPFGTLDKASIAVAGSTATLAVKGWAIDGVKPATSIPVHIYVTDPAGTQKAHVVNASVARPDVAAVYPEAGANHGYTLNLPVSTSGNYQVCSYAIGTKVSGDNNVQLGCSTTTLGPSAPIGTIDRIGLDVVGKKAQINLRGWALDNGLRSESTQVHVYLTDPTGVTRSFRTYATVSRPDIASAYPGAGDAHGYSWAASITKGGKYKVCVYAIGAQVFKGSSKNLGCRDFQLGPSAPTGSFDLARYNAASKSISTKGWTIDLGLRHVSSATHLYVTAPGGKTSTYAVPAAASRPDVAAAFPGAGPFHGFTHNVPVSSAGTYTVCAYTITVPALASANKLLSCKTVAVP